MGRFRAWRPGGAALEELKLSNKEDALAFNPLDRSVDGSHFLAGVMAVNKTLWEFKDKRLVPLRSVPGEFWRAAISRGSSSRIALGGGDGLAIWDFENTPPRKAITLSGGAEQFSELQFAKDDSLLVVRVGRAITIRNAARPDEPPRPVPGDAFETFDVSPDGKFLATAGQGASGVKIWDIDDPAKPLMHLGRSGLNVDFSPDGRYLAASRAEAPNHAVVEIHDLATGLRQREIRFPGAVNKVVYTDDGRHLVTANANGTIYVLRLEEAKTE
jgi:WD40 repeat protein